KRTSRLVDFGQSLEIAYAHDWEGWALRLGLEGGLGSRDTPAQESRLRWLGGSALIERRFVLGAPVRRLGRGASLDYVFQTLRRPDASVLSAAGYEVERRLSAPAAGARAVVGLRVPIFARLWLGAELRGEVIAARMEGDIAAFFGAAAA